MLTNFALPRHAITKETASFRLSGAKSDDARATIQRIDLEHANAKRRWEQMGKPEYLSGAMVTELGDVSKLKTEAQTITFRDGALDLEVAMPPQSVASINVSFQS